MGRIIRALTPVVAGGALVAGLAAGTPALASTQAKVASSAHHADGWSLYATGVLKTGDGNCAWPKGGYVHRAQAVTKQRCYDFMMWAYYMNARSHRIQLRIPGTPYAYAAQRGKVVILNRFRAVNRHKVLLKNGGAAAGNTILEFAFQHGHKDVSTWGRLWKQITLQARNDLSYHQRFALPGAGYGTNVGTDAAMSHASGINLDGLTFYPSNHCHAATFCGQLKTYDGHWVGVTKVARGEAVREMNHPSVRPWDYWQYADGPQQFIADGTNLAIGRKVSGHASSVALIRDTRLNAYLRDVSSGHALIFAFGLKPGPNALILTWHGVGYKLTAERHDGLPNQEFAFVKRTHPAA